MSCDVTFFVSEVLVAESCIPVLDLGRTFKFLSRTFCLWVASQLALESRRGFGC